jgi:hypothetical protein
MLLMRARAWPSPFTSHAHATLTNLPRATSQPNDIDLWDCKGSAPGADKNEEFYYNASSGEIVSLDTNPCCQGMCLGL